jgi:hypothetical protein
VIPDKPSDNIIDRPNGTYDLTIAGFEDDYSFVRFVDGAKMLVAGNHIVVYVCFWKAFFTRAQYDRGIPREDIDKLVGTNVRAYVFDKQTRSGKTVRIASVTKL